MSETTWIIVAYVIPLALLWAAILIDLIRRTDIGLGRKALWVAVALVTAEFGAVLYIAFRPLRYPEDNVAPGSGNPLADQLLNAAESGDENQLASARSEALSAIG